jgi:CMP/dCMP kinase
LSVLQNIDMAIPHITIDGPTASGKGTVAQIVARTLGWHYLDSGAIYRACALYAMDEDVPLAEFDRVAKLAAKLPLRFTDAGQVWLGVSEVTDAIRAEAVGNAASIISASPPVRAALLQRQRDFLVAPGLVTDGRDMGSVVFPDAPLKVFLTASAQARAQRRYNQLIANGKNVIMMDLVRDLQARDQRDTERAIAPLKATADAHLLDTSGMDAQSAADTVLRWWRERAIQIHR